MEALLPIMKEMKADLTTLKEYLTSLNETVIQLSGDVEEHKNWTKSELADLQSSINNPPTGAISRAVLLTLLPYLNNIEENLSTDLNSLISDRAATTDESVSSLRRDLEMNKNWTMSELAHLQSSIDSVPDAALLKLLPYMNNIEENLLTDLSSLISDRATSIDASVSSLSGDLEEHKNQTTFEVADLQTSLQSSINSTLCQKVKEIKDTIISLPVHTCGGTGGWRRAVYLDMTDNNTDCPSGWNETGYSKRTCGRASVASHTCDSVTIPVSGGEYSQVCGRTKAYQWGPPWGFYGYRQGQATTDDAYFTGVAVMHGSPRQHIWTFAAGEVENYTSEASTLCPCDTTFNIPIPPFVGEDYFCESGYVWPGYYRGPSVVYTLHSNDTLWDGRDCHSSSTCCSQHNPPYFTKTLNRPTTDDIELRMCISSNSVYSRHVDIAVELIELYVKN